MLIHQIQTYYNYRKQLTINVLTRYLVIYKSVEKISNLLKENNVHSENQLG